MSDPLELCRRAGSPEQTRALGAALARRLRAAFLAGELDALVITLDGELGAGKTTFSQGFVTAWAEDPELYVTSPSFAIVHSYDCQPPLHHLDLYRLDSLDELEALGYRELYFSGGVALVEWASRVPEALPAERLEIRLAVEGADVRLISTRAHATQLQPLLSEFFTPCV